MVEIFGFRRRFAALQQRGRWVGVGLDPLLDKMPAMFRQAHASETAALVAWMIWIVDLTAPFACCYKPQAAYWENIPGGMVALQAVVAYIKTKYPEIPIFLDCKRGDIDRTQSQYAQAILGLNSFDGMNVNAYMGVKDTVGPVVDLIDRMQKGSSVVCLGRTSNSGAWTSQDRMLANGRRVWEDDVCQFLDFLREQSRNMPNPALLENAGVVMGSAYVDEGGVVHAEHLVRFRELVGDDLYTLCPGFGTQGGEVHATFAAAYRGPGSIIPFSSSGINFAQDPGLAAKNLNDEIVQVIVS